MEIIDKKTYKTEIKKRVDKYMKEFPFYFLFNIFLNFILIFLIILSALFVVMGAKSGIGEAGYGFIAIVGLLSVLGITSSGFFKNINTLKSIREGDYDFEIEDHEMDNAIEFIEDLPAKKEDVEKLRLSLSYDKIFDVLETVDIIVCKNGSYDINLRFKYQVEQIMESENYRKNNMHKV